MKAALLVPVLAVTAGAARFPLIGVDDEIRLGREAQRQVRQEVPRVADREVAAYVAGLGRRLARHARGPKYPYSFTVANYREINAFALPGGPVWIHRGAIAAAANEAQLAAVLAHEVAHISERHAANRISTRLVADGFIGLLGAMLGSNKGAEAAQMGARVLAGGYMLTFSRDDEREADIVGAAIMRRAGWDATQMIAFMETMRRVQGRNPASLEVFLSSHPAPAERVERLRGRLKAGGTRDSAAFRRIRGRLGRLPAARAMPRR